MADAGFFRVSSLENYNLQILLAYYYSLLGLNNFILSLILQGTTTDQDARFSDKEKKLLKTMKFEDNLGVKVDMSKVKVDVLKPWITKRVYEMLKMEDDVVVEFIFNQLEDEKVSNVLTFDLNVANRI